MELFNRNRLKMKHLKQLTLPLHDLVMNFHSLMVEENAKYFTVAGAMFSLKYWYITDVRPDGTYPCHPTDEAGNVYQPTFLDYQQRVTIHFNV